jgi:amicyanin
MKKIIRSLGVATMLLSHAAWAEDHEIIIKDHKYVPAELIIKAGEKVTWVNKDQDPHNVMDKASPKVFHSAALDTADHYSFTFAQTGIYAYFCTFHPIMEGKITVQ